jgi:hypothetical protein
MAEQRQKRVSILGCSFAGVVVDRKCERCFQESGAPNAGMQ